MDNKKEKRDKFSLDELEVQSFVTSFDTSAGETKDLKGGSLLCFSAATGCDDMHSVVAAYCNTDPEACADTTDPVLCDDRHTERTPSGCGTAVCQCY